MKEKNNKPEDTPLVEFTIGDGVVPVSTADDIAKLAREMCKSTGVIPQDDEDKAITEMIAASDVVVAGTDATKMDVGSYAVRLNQKLKDAETSRKETINTLRQFRMAIDQETQLIQRSLARAHNASVEIKALADAMNAVNDAYADIKNGSMGFRILLEGLMDAVDRENERRRADEAAQKLKEMQNEQAG